MSAENPSPPPKPPTESEVDSLLARLDREAEQGGYHLNPDRDFTRDLVRGLLVNSARYGYPSCPCRVGAGNLEEDRDIVCPCDYRDPDLDEFGVCYCALYVSEEIKQGRKQAGSIPERRPSRPARGAGKTFTGTGALPYPVWRCKVCGYLCARNAPPEVCPVCKAKKDRFERFL